MTRGDSDWWRTAVVYQIYPRSFADASGDGIGDLAGAVEHLDHVAALGVDAVWVSPFYVSPQADGGYDISDFRDVDPLFGTLADFDRLVSKAHQLGVRLIVDLVPNHTSSAHPWFREALASGPGSRARDRYIFRDGKGLAGELPPNNWQSLFTGSAWTRVMDEDGTPGQWYLHFFDASQPDLNWDSAEVREEFEDILRFWLDRGVDGFRVDVARGLVKAAGLPDYPEAYQVAPQGAPDGTRTPMFDQPAVHDIYRSWRRLLDGHGDDRILVAEAHVQPQSRLAMYVRPDEMNHAFNFEYLHTPYSAEAIRHVIDESLRAAHDVGAPATWVLNDHDDPRHRTRLALQADGSLDPASGLARALTATAIMLALPGAAYLYQGEELGLPDVVDIPPHARRDPTFARSGGLVLGRDGCRVPMPWRRSGETFGFSAGTESWLPQPPEWGELSVEAQVADPRSTLSFYRAAIAARRDFRLGDGSLEWARDARDGILDFTVAGVRVVANLSAAAVPMPAGPVILATGELGDGGLLAPDTAAWVGVLS